MAKPGQNIFKFKPLSAGHKDGTVTSQSMPGWDAPKNGTFSVSGFSGIKFQNGRSFVCMDLHINQLEYIITRVAMICGIG